MREPVATNSHAEMPVGSVLKAAVERQEVPPDLAGKIRDTITNAGERKVSLHFGGAWQWVAAAAMLLSLAGWTVFKNFHPAAPLPGLADRAGQDVYIRNISAMIPTVLRVGLGDHLHCSVFRKYPKNPPALAEMQTKLGPDYGGLIQAVLKAVPSGYRVIMAHRCGYRGRKFVHLTLTDGQKLISLVIAQRQEGESMQGLQPATQNRALQIYQSSTGSYHVASFETASQFAFVVSELSPEENLAITRAIAGDVLLVLSKAKA